MLKLIAKLVFWSLQIVFRSRVNIAIENMALRQQLAVFKHSLPRPQLRHCDRVFWVALKETWAKWASILILVSPETVVRWHRQSFRRYWRWKSRPRRPGRPRIEANLRAQIRRMCIENPTWGAPKIHGELLKLGYELDQSTVSRYMGRPRKPPSQTWRTFLANHAKAILACDFFTVPTATFRLLFVFVVLSHDRRRSSTST